MPSEAQTNFAPILVTHYCPTKLKHINMGSSSEKRLLRKQKKKRHRDSKKREYEKDRQISASLAAKEAFLPTYSIVELDPAPDRVVGAIKDAWIRIAQAPELRGEKLEDLKTAKKQGLYRSKYGPFNWVTWLGTFLFRELVRDISPVVLRRVDVEVIATDDLRSHVEIRIRALESVKGFIACSPSKPKVTLPNGEFVVAFNLRDDDHFIRRLEERTVVYPEHYLSKGQVFACLYRWKLFDPIILPSGQPALRLWNWCDPKVPVGSLWKEFLGSEIKISDTLGIQFFQSELGLAYYLVGYCPIDESKLSSGYAVLDTLLLPGMDNTPEARAMQKGLDTKERINFEKQAEQQTMKNLNLQKDFSIVREYHKHVPQVRFFSDTVFDYEHGK